MRYLNTPNFIKKSIWPLLIVPFMAMGLTIALPALADPAPPGEVQATEEPADTPQADGSPAETKTPGDTTPASKAGGTVTASYKLANPFGTSDLRVIIGRFGSIMTNIVGSLALLMFVYGGFIMLTSRGNADKIKQGREVFIWTTIGLVIIFGAQAIITAIINVLSTGHL